mgnify:CR=1 FL=1
MEGSKSHKIPSVMRWTLMTIGLVKFICIELSMPSPLEWYVPSPFNNLPPYLDKKEKGQPRESNRVEPVRAS